MAYPTKAVKERWRREDEARDRLQELPPDASDLEFIEAAADYLIAQGHGGKWQLSVLVDADKPVEHDWAYKNVRGITTMDADRARAWIRTCMQLGYCVFSSRTKRGTGAGPGNVEHLRKQATEHAERRSWLVRHMAGKISAG